MAALTETHLERLRSGAGTLAVTALVVAASVAAGYWFALLARPLASNRMLPWIAGSALGLGAYAALTALVALGLWFRHPWRARHPLLSPEATLRVHAALAVATLLLVIGHLTSLALDRYAGVGWRGALLPGQAGYRPVAVTLGVTAAYLMLGVVATAGLAGRVTGRHWLTVHRVGVPLYALVWFHGVLAGTDTSALRVVYLSSGLLVAALAAGRRLPGAGPR